jgi:hypothetical protein
VTCSDFSYLLPCSRPPFINYKSQEIKVRELCREHFGFILYTTEDGKDFYLELMKNKSAFHWEETIKIDEAGAKELIAEPTYAKAVRGWGGSDFAAFQGTIHPSESS